MKSTTIIESDATDALKNHALVSLLPLLTNLSDGQWHTGVSLGKKLGISRAAIWKQLKKLSEHGVALQSHAQKGYRLEHSIDWLSSKAILASMPANKSCVKSLQYFRLLDSTNQYLLDHWKRFSDAENDPLCLQVCLTEWQAHGRGRRGKTWFSPFAGNICASIGWMVAGGASALEGISLVAGLVLAETLESFGFNDIALKWPNDLLVSGQKLAGLLVEIRGDISGDCFCVLGIGLNVSMSAHNVDTIEQAWVDLSQLAEQQSIECPSRNQVLGVFLSRLASALLKHKKEGFSGFCQPWRSRDAFLGKTIRFQQGAEWAEGIAMGINEQGALKVQTQNNEILLHGGEISVRSVCSS